MAITTPEDMQKLMTALVRQEQRQQQKAQQAAPAYAGGGPADVGGYEPNSGLLGAVAQGMQGYAAYRQNNPVNYATRSPVATVPNSAPKG